MTRPGITILRRRLLAEIDAYLARTGMSASRFSKLAVNDPVFVTGLRAEWPTIGPKRAKAERAFMRAHPKGE